MPSQNTSRAESGNLALIYQELLTTIVRLRSAEQQPVTDARYFRRQFQEALRAAEDQARNRGYSVKDIRETGFAVVAFLDESVLNLRDPVFAEWARKPLQEEIFQRHMGGEVFFQNLDSMTREMESASLADVMEIYLLCILLGYSGKYGGPENGELKMLAQSVLARIRRVRRYPDEISPDWKPVMGSFSQGGRASAINPFLLTAVLLLITAIALFIGYKVVLNQSVSAVASNVFGVSQ